MPKTLSSFENEIMQAIWQHEPATVRQILDAVNQSRESEVARTSVLKQVQRLEQSGYIKRDDSRPARYASLVTQNDATKKVTKSIVESFFGGSPLRLVKQLVSQGDLSKEEIDQLSKLITDSENKENL